MAKLLSKISNRCPCCRGARVADAPVEDDPPGPEADEGVGEHHRSQTVTPVSAAAWLDFDDSDVNNAVRDAERDEEEESRLPTRIMSQVFHATVHSKPARKIFRTKTAMNIEKHRQDGLSFWMIHPFSKFKYIWDAVMLTILTFIVVYLPVSVSFFREESILVPGWLTVNIVLDVLFISDIIINFRTGIMMEGKAEKIILDQKLVAIHYLKTWFAVDLISSLPLDYITLIFVVNGSTGAILKISKGLRILRLVKLFRLLRLLRFSKLLQYLTIWEEFFDLAGGAVRIFKLVVMMLVLAHWNGCVQFLVPVLQDFPQNSWITINHLENSTITEQYSWALFKAISHMLCIGFGRWPPQNVTEAWLTIVSMMIGATFYALFIGNMSTLLLSIDSSGRLYNERVSQVEEYMRYRKLPQSLRQRVLDYYEHRYRRKFFNEDAILNELSAGLREDIIKHNCKDLVCSVPFFQCASAQFVTAITTKLQFEVFPKNEYIIRAGTFGDRMFFISSGSVHVVTEDGEVIATLSEGAHFGEICLLTEKRRVASIKAAMTVDLFSLSKKNFEGIIQEYPDVRDAIALEAVGRLNTIRRESEAEELRSSMQELYGKGRSGSHRPETVMEEAEPSVSDQIVCDSPAMIYSRTTSSF